MKNPCFTTPEIVAPSKLQVLVDRAPDKELLLTLELCFLNYVWPTELPGLEVADFIFDCGVPVRLSVGQRQLSRRARMIPINPTHRPVFRALLPGSGPLFLSPRPYARLRLLATNLGMDLPPRIALRSCVAYGWYSGLSADEVAARAGLASPSRLKCVPYAMAAAKESFRLDFNLRHYARRPRYCGPGALPLELKANPPRRGGITQ